MNREQRYICNQQKELFEYAQKQGADIGKFAKNFLNSNFCNNNLDKPYSTQQYDDIFNWLEFLEFENCLIIPENKNNIPIEVAGWLGFTYRHLHFNTGLLSKEIINKVPVEKLLRAYLGLHTVDEEMAIEIIINNFWESSSLNQ